MDQVRLKMNNSKTEFIYFEWPSQLEKCITNKIDVNGEEITRADHTRYLGGIPQQETRLQTHTSKQRVEQLF